jgi:aspartyl-tRNA(Asn)/glutamyl-tRNA(Gln) amidotransferase subunit A
MTDLTSLTLAEAREGLANKSFTSLELTDAHLEAIEAARALNAFVLETPDQARAMVRAIDARIAKGEGGPLAGIPLGIKDLFATKDVRTTACSKILGNFVPTYESTVTSQLWRDGAVMLGKLNNDEFAMGSSNETSCFGPVVNPWRREGSNTALVPGGSSGGSASAVAALLCMGATATDTGGSIRQPAAFTATVGVKPTYGRCSRWASSRSHPRRSGRADRADRPGCRDPAALDGRSRPQGHHIGQSRGAGLRGRDRNIGQGMKIGIPRVSPRRHARGNRKLGPRARPGLVAAPSLSTCRCRTPNTRCRLLHCRARGGLVEPRATTACAGGRVPGRSIGEMYENTRAEGFGAEVRRRVMIGTYVLGRLLRRLLSARAESPHVDQEGF